MEKFIKECVEERVNPEYHWISNGYNGPSLQLVLSSRLANDTRCLVIGRKPLTE
jgi:hypothetical protein